MLPQHRHAVEGVDDAVIVGEAEGNGAGVEGASEAESASGDGHGGAQVQLHRVVQLVRVDSVDLRDVEVAIGREPVEDPGEELHKSETKLWWENYLEEALTEGQHTKKGGQGGPVLLHFWHKFKSSLPFWFFFFFFFSFSPFL